MRELIRVPLLACPAVRSSICVSPHCWTSPMVSGILADGGDQSARRGRRMMVVSNHKAARSDRPPTAHAAASAHMLTHRDPHCSARFFCAPTRQAGFVAGDLSLTLGQDWGDLLQAGSATGYD